MVLFLILGFVAEEDPVGDTSPAPLPPAFGSIEAMSPGYAGGSRGVVDGILMKLGATVESVRGLRRCKWTTARGVGGVYGRGKQYLGVRALWTAALEWPAESRAPLSGRYDARRGKCPLANVDRQALVWRGVKTVQLSDLAADPK